MRYYTIVISGGTIVGHEYTTQAAQWAAGSRQMADLVANSGLFDDAVLLVETDGTLAFAYVPHPSPEDVAAARKPAGRR